MAVFCNQRHSCVQQVAYRCRSAQQYLLRIPPQNKKKDLTVDTNIFGRTYGMIYFKTNQIHTLINIHENESKGGIGKTIS